MGGSVSKKQCEEISRNSSRHGYTQECYDYFSNYLFPPSADEHRCSTSLEPSQLTSNSSQPLPSAPVLPDPDAYDKEEEKQFNMAIRESLKVTNLPIASSSLSMNRSYAWIVGEEERQIDMAIRVSLKAPNFPRASSSPILMNPSYGQEWSSSRFDICSSSTSSHSQEPQMSSAQQIPNHSRRELVECGICYEVSMPAICDPCGHVCCYECLLQIQGITNRCPRCRRVITKVLRIYL